MTILFKQDWGPYLNCDLFFPMVHPDVDISLGKSFTSLAENVNTGEVFIFYSIEEACRLLGLNPRTCQTYRMRHGKDSVFKNWRFLPFTKETYSNVVKRKTA